MLKKGGRTLIIDTKCYGRVLRARHEVGKVHNHNLYQIFTYVMNEDKDGSGSVSGMLLYAKTAEKISPDMSFYIKNNHFMVKTLDLNTDFKSIKEQLESIAYNEFPELRQTVS